MTKTNLIEYLKKNGKSSDKTWYDLAVEFNIGENLPRSKRAKKTQDIWRQYRGTKKSGRKKVVTKITTNPNGKDWVTYKVSDPDIEDLFNELKNKFRPNEIISYHYHKDHADVGIVTISDLHIGSLLKKNIDTTDLREEFSDEVIVDMLNNATSIINGMKFKEVHLFIPGDIIESFTGFNHQDTYRHVQAHLGEVVILAYNIIKKLLSQIVNLKCVYMVEGNHDRLTKKKGTIKRGVTELVSYFLSQTSKVEIKYHPFLLSEVINGVNYLCTHGDHTPYKRLGYESFFFNYGKQGMFNVLQTGHYHRFNVLKHTKNYLHFECPSIYAGGIYDEYEGFHNAPGITIIKSGDVKKFKSLSYIPL